MEHILFWFIVYGISGVLFGYIARKISTEKGRSSIEWFLYGFFLWALGIIVVLILPAIEGKPAQVKLLDGVSKECPYCSEIIKFEAVVCGFCGKKLSNGTPIEDVSQFLPNQENNQYKKPYSLINLLLLSTSGFTFGALVGKFISDLITFLLLFGTSMALDSWIIESINNMINYGIIGIGGGLALGYISSNKFRPWILAGFVGCGLGGLLSTGISINDMYFHILVNKVLTSVIIAISAGISFSIVCRNWKNLIWLVLSGALGFSLYSIFLLSRLPPILEVFIGGAIIGLCYSLIFGLLVFNTMNKISTTNSENLTQ